LDQRGEVVSIDPHADQESFMKSKLYGTYGKRKAYSLEIRAAEGGDDAKLLVEEQASVYLNFAKKHGIEAHVVDAGKG
jgi:protein subunit release factor A